MHDTSGLGDLMATAAQDVWVLRVLGLDTGVSAADLGGRLGIIRDDMLRLGAGGELSGLLREAAVAVKAGAAGAAALVEALEDRLAAFASSQRAAEAAATVAAAVNGSLSPLALAKIRLTLGSTRSRVEGAIETLQAACESLLESGSFATDPRSHDPATFAAIAALGQRVPPVADLAGDLSDTLDRMVSATDPDARKREQQNALKAVGAYRARIDSVPLLREMESSPAGTFAIHGAMVAALDELSTGLRG